MLHCIRTQILSSRQGPLCTELGCRKGNLSAATISKQLIGGQNDHKYYVQLGGRSCPVPHRMIEDIRGCQSEDGEESSGHPGVWCGTVPSLGNRSAMIRSKVSRLPIGIKKISRSSLGYTHLVSADDRRVSAEAWAMVKEEFLSQHCPKLPRKVVTAPEANSEAAV